MHAISFPQPALVKFLKSLATALALALVVFFPVNPGAAAGQERVATLKAGEPVGKNLAGGQQDKYQIAVEAGQYLHVVVEQEGVDVLVRAKSPDGQEIESDAPYGLRGYEEVALVAKSAGVCSLEVVAPNKGVADGSYRIKVEALRAATDADARRALAVQASAQARKAASPGEAVSKLKEALALRDDPEDRRGRAYALTALAQAQMRNAEYDEALKNFDSAREFWRASNSLREQAYLLSESGAAYRNLLKSKRASGSLPAAAGDEARYREEALARYGEARQLYLKAGDAWGQAWVLNNAGFFHHDAEGQASAAMDYYKQALPLWQASRDRNMEINTLNNIGGVFHDLGDLQQALASHEEVRRIGEELGNKLLRANSYNNIGLVYDVWGESQTALSHYDQALTLFRELGDQAREAIALHNIATVYSALGDSQRALDYFDQSLTIRRKLKLDSAQAQTLTSIGMVYSRQGDQAEALKHYRQALPLRPKSNKRALAYTITNIGLAHALSGDPRGALGEYAEALKLREGDRQGEAITLDKIGHAHGLLGERAKALENYEKALVRWRAIGDRHGEALTLYGVARAERDGGNLAAAREAINKAVSIVESLRSKVSNQQLRTSYLATKQNYYELEVDVNMRLYLDGGGREEGYAAAALQASEKARARSLLDTLAEAQADLSQAADPQLVGKADSLQQQIDAMAERLLALRNVNRPDDAASVAKRLDALTAEYEDVQARLRDANPRYAALTRPRPLDLPEIRKQLLDDNTILLEYALGEEHSYLWAVTQTSVRGFRLSGSDDIKRAALRVRDLAVVWQRTADDEEGFAARVIKARGEYWPQAEELSRLLLGAVSKQLGTKRLLIVPDGILHLVPFTALPAPAADASARPLAMRASTRPVAMRAGTRAVAGRTTARRQPALLANEVVVVPSVSTLALLRTYRRPAAPKALAVLADPVFGSDDERVRVKGERNFTASAAQTWSRDLNQAVQDTASPARSPGLARLRATEREAAEIIAATPDGAGMKATDFKATRALVMSGQLSQYRILHFATHGLLDTERPHLSGIVLSLVDEEGRRQNGYLRLQDIYTLKLPSELVVLSACDTGLGKEIKGEGLISLTRGFMHAGAKRVVASLWKVDSDATAELMKGFYHGMFKRGLPPAAALKFAQGEVRRNKQWSDPYFWAGFVFQGEWQRQ